MKTILPILFLFLCFFTGFSQDTIQNKTEQQLQFEKMTDELKKIQKEIKHIQILNLNLLKKDSLNRLDIDSLRNDLKNFRVPELVVLELRNKNEIEKIHDSYVEERNNTSDKLGWMLGLIGVLITVVISIVGIAVPLVLDKRRMNEFKKEIDGIKTNIEQSERVAAEAAKKAEISELSNKAENEEDPNQKIDMYSKIIEMDADSFESYNNRGAAYFDKGEYDKAILEYNKAIELNFNYTEAYSNRGNAHADKGEYAKSIVDFNKAIELSPNASIVYYNRGCVYSDKGEYAKAIADYNRTIELNPNASNAYENRGNAYKHNGEYVKAIMDYNKTIELNPNKPGAYNNLADLYYNQGEFNTALDYVEKAIICDVKYTIAYLTRCEIHYKLAKRASTPQEEERFKKLAFDDKLVFDKLLKLELDLIKKAKLEKLASENNVIYEDLKPKQ